MEHVTSFQTKTSLRTLQILNNSNQALQITLIILIVLTICVVKVLLNTQPVTEYRPPIPFRQQPPALSLTSQPPQQNQIQIPPQTNINFYFDFVRQSLSRGRFSIQRLPEEAAQEQRNRNKRKAKPGPGQPGYQSKQINLEYKKRQVSGRNENKVRAESRKNYK
eukprot:snap_masked-scaffold_16-processed-gene-4.16-mRNA-1 protein AED:1.00 eAED:1.00 QI:0/0/0/0/1/1/2/0/163